MLELLSELKPALIDIIHPDVSLSDAQWNEVKQLDGLLSHPFLTTKKLQAAYLTPGSFFKECKKLIFKFSQIGGILADAMRTSMECHKNVLLDSNMLLAAVYVDPIYRATLNDEECAKGTKLLFPLNIMKKKGVVQTCSRKKIKAKKTFQLPQSQKMRTFKSYLTGRQSAAKLTSKMRLVIHLHFDCSKWTSTMH